ncbi:hypothetical protein [Sulfurirhabdus autotrophica]|uniref:Uncharacterized protein n=1 Tax=Sulfurirhabdus autotrophica TaxID=1706046 RepID=A0A4R3YAX7_9PROT|nr:hypothetical protein [Sulfurirhabdus autotrophica]TCV89575.1 hypothetical protein EDC63_10293 [Sulfurirhabdus autotrophica]
MTTPQTYIAFTPRGAGLLCAVTYIEMDNHVFGWWIGYHDAAFPSAFFKLANFFSLENPAFFVTDGLDIYGGWKFNYSLSAPKLAMPIPVEDEICHQLNQQQNAFITEWLFFNTDADIEEIKAYHQNELPVQNVNIKYKKLNKLDQSNVIWTYASNNLSQNVIEYMASRWPLDYGKP